MINKRWTKAMAFACSTVMALTAGIAPAVFADETEAAGDEDHVIKVGAVCAMTGGSAVYGTGAQNAIDMAVDEINSSDSEYKIEIVNGGKVADDAKDAKQAVNAYNLLKSEAPEAIVGSFFSAVTIPMAQLAANSGLVRHFGELAKAAGFKGLACIVSDPVDNLCRAFLESSDLKPFQVQGYGLGVMNARACYYAEKDPRLTHYLTEGRAFGPHGQDLVIADSLIHYNDALSRELTQKVVTCNLAVRDLGYKPYIAPALSSAAISILLTLRGEWHYGSLYLGDGTRGAFLGIKNRLTAGGFEYEDAALCPQLYDRIRNAYINLCNA